MIIITQNKKAINLENIEWLNLTSSYSYFCVLYDWVNEKNKNNEESFRNVITGLVRFPLESRGKVYFLGEYATLQEAKRKYDLLTKLNQVKDSNIEFYM